MEKIEILQIEKLSGERLLQRLDNIEAKLEELTLTKEHSQLQANDLMTRKELSELLQVTVQTLHSWHVKNLLRAIRIGNRVRYKRSEVEAFLSTDSSKIKHLGRKA